MRLTADSIAAAITAALKLHDRRARAPVLRVRKFDHKTPQGVHPALGTLLLLHEERIPWRQRVVLAEAFCYHDLLEDTTASLPKGTTKRVRKLVQELTFPPGLTKGQEWWRVHRMSKEAKLLKLVDKLTSLFNPSNDLAYERQKCERVNRLALVVLRDFGLLICVQLALDWTRQRLQQPSF